MVNRGMNPCAVLLSYHLFDSWIEVWTRLLHSRSTQLIRVDDSCRSQNKFDLPPMHQATGSACCHSWQGVFNSLVWLFSFELSGMTAMLRVLEAHKLPDLDKVLWNEGSTTQKMKCSTKDFSSKCDTNPQETAGLVTITEEILNGKLHFLCSIVLAFH